MDLVTEALKILRNLLEEQPSYTGQRSLENLAKTKLETFVGTNSQYQEELQKTIKELRFAEDQVRRESQAKVQAQWELVQKLVSEEEGVQSSPKLSQAWSLAWEKGHSSGYEEVVNEFRSLAVLL